MDALACTYLLERFESEVGIMAFEESIALQKLALDALGVSARGKRLSVPIFLVAWSAGRCTGGAAWML